MNPQTENQNWIKRAEKLAKGFAERAAQNDREMRFVEENYAELKEAGFFSLLVPTELGGAGLSHGEMCDILRIFGQHCGSTALAFSMHQHLVAANVWKYRKGKGGEEVLKKVADKQLVLVSTGARDWMDSNGEMTKVDGGYRFSGQKFFASQSSGGDVLVTSAPYNHPTEGWQVLHFPVPFSAEGLSVRDDWQTLGMRGTGSNTVVLKDVFVPESAIGLARGQGEFAPFWNVVITVAMPLIMSAYLGVAERAAQIVIERAKGWKDRKPHVPYQVGELNNELSAAQIQWQDMIRICNNFDFEAVHQNAQDILTRKTNIATAVIGTVTKAMALAGGAGFYEKTGLERLFRDIQGAHHHPLPERDQQLFSGNHLLKG